MRDTIHYGARIAIEGGRIAAIGPTAELAARYPAAETIDGTRQADHAGLRQHAHASHHDAGARRLRGPLAAAQAALHRRPLAHAAARRSRRDEQR